MPLHIHLSTHERDLLELSRTEKENPLLMLQRKRNELDKPIAEVSL